MIIKFPIVYIGIRLTFASDSYILIFILNNQKWFSKMNNKVYNYFLDFWYIHENLE